MGHDYTLLVNYVHALNLIKGILLAYLAELLPQVILIDVCQHIKEAITVNGQSVDDLLDYWLHLHIGKDSTTNGCVHDVQDLSAELIH